MSSLVRNVPLFTSLEVSPFFALLLSLGPPPERSPAPRFGRRVQGEAEAGARIIAVVEAGLRHGWLAGGFQCEGFGGLSTKRIAAGWGRGGSISRCRRALPL